MVTGMQTRKSAAQWGELVSAWEASGRTAEVFASEHGVAGSTLRWWKAELAKRARNEAPRRPPRRQSRTTVSRIALARVVRPGEVPASTGARGSVAVLVGGARIVVEAGFDGRLLREVVRALEEAR
ncbi:MAG: hypothetical protein C4308_15000 [Chitinophagaceae bacterium]